MTLEQESHPMRPSLIAMTMLAMVACQGATQTGSVPVGAAMAPPTQLERSMLGQDADDAYFLQRFRSCAAFGSYTYCQAEMYGGLPQ